jgi:3-carboxy-cis,cis-muconate cycloisomerase
MPAHVTESVFFKDIYGTDSMRSVFGDESLIQYWLDVESALARVQAEMGIIPTEAAEEITRKARAGNLDFADMALEMEKTSHPIVPLIRALQRICDGDTGQYIHWGATTQDITDTGIILQLRDAIGLIQDDLEVMEGALLDLARTHRNTVMPGRTHGQHALPITFGYKVAVWAAEVRRHLERIEQARPRILVGQFAGAVGTLASVSADGMEIQRRLLSELNLDAPTICWNTARDAIAEAMSLLGLITATVGKIANEIVNLQRTEIGELEEPFVMGKVGSSTMPHKRNPMICEAIVGVSRLVRQNIPAALEAMAHAHERDWAMIHMEWAFVPETCLYTAGALTQLNRVINGLIVYPDRMASNLDMLKGLLLSEAVMLRLAESVGRQDAHDLVYLASMHAHEQHLPLKDVLLRDSEVSKHLSPQELEDLLRPERYTGLAGEFVDRVAQESYRAKQK